MAGMNYVASLSGGKDSLAMVLRLIEEKKPLTHIVFYDTGMEFKAIYRVIGRMELIAEENGISFVRLKPDEDFLTKMMIHPVHFGTNKERYGYDWCGGRCRWATTDKTKSINRYLKSLGEYQQYIGIAYDEPKRIKNENCKLYPLVEWGMTEADCLQYCYANGWNWDEDGVDLYQVLDRVSCWCCGNKNLKELKAMKEKLPKYWALLKGMQSKIDRPFKGKKSIFDLEKEWQNIGKTMA